MQRRRNNLLVRLRRTLRRTPAGKSRSTPQVEGERDRNNRTVFPSARYVLRRFLRSSRRQRSTTTSSEEEVPSLSLSCSSTDGLLSSNGGRPTLPPPQQPVSESREPEPLAIIETDDDGCVFRTSTPNFQEVQVLDHFTPSDVGLYSWSESFEDLSELSIDDDDSCIKGEEISLEKLTASSPQELVYNAYWHGRVSVHARYFGNSHQREKIQADINALRKVRHENIQLFMGVSVDLHTDYIVILMTHMRGETMESMLQWRDFRSNFDDFMKITEQIAHGLNYLHSKGIYHPLLTSQSITINRTKPCISMLAPGYASMGLLKTTDLSYLPPEALSTVKKFTINENSSNSPPSSPHSIHGLKKCFTPPTELVFGLPNSSGYSRLAPGSPNIRSSRRIMEAGYASHRRGSTEDHTTDISTPVRKVVLKGSKTMMQSAEANVYAFGTLLFEFIMNRKPACSLKGTEVHEVLLFPQGRIKQMVKGCWNTRPAVRPSFADLLYYLENNVSPKNWLSREHFTFSISIPENLDLL